MPYVPISPTVNGGNVVAGQNLAVGTTAIAFAALNTATNLVVVQVHANDVYATFDGTTPSATNGARLYANQPFHWNSDTARRAKFIQVAATARIYAQEFTTSLEKTAMPEVAVVKPPNLGAYGFFVNVMTAIGDMISGGASGVPTRVAANTTSTKKFMTETGTGSAGTAPGWNTIVASDLPAGTGTVTSVTAGTGLSGGTITTSGTISLTIPVTVPDGGTGVTGIASSAILLGNGAGAIVATSNLTGDASGNTTQAGNHTFSTSGDGIVGNVRGATPDIGNAGYTSGIGLSSSSAITLSSGTVVNVVSNTFPAGNFLVWGNVWFVGTATANPFVGGISTVSASLPGVNSAAETQTSAAITVGGFEGNLPITPKVFRSSVGFTLYLVSAASFTGTLTTFGGMSWLQLP